MAAPQVVIDTNVFVSALLSRRGAAYRLLTLVGSGLFQLNVSVPLIIEYEDAARRILHQTVLTPDNLSDILDYLCQVSNRQKIFFLWRPFLRDAKDDMVLELAAAVGCDSLITFNTKGFAGIERFGLKAMTPQTFLRQIGQIP
ncbi:MAG: putative toxin-antitoxin system toxin component, PIN family [Ardenticatenaceae bacterium]|nr:putative toxin-antitoxin system toxin component, PIN family [Ardenticatenaceae bacterium]